MADMPRILDCSVTSCSYNKEKSCGAAAITVGYSTSCTTFIPLTVKGGLAKSETFVGACQKADCAHNNALECTAASISVGAGTADCSPTRRAESHSLTRPWLGLPATASSYLPQINSASLA